MTYQYITLQMLQTAKTNGGFIDQTAFKTEFKYAFDTLILCPEVLQILDNYVTLVRPLLNPTCEYLVLTTNGRQYTAFGSAMSLLVHQTIGKYVNPTRYRQIIETESAEKLTPAEMDAISKDQKHSSYVAKRVYQKRLSREVATEGKSCMEKIVGTERDDHTKQLASILGDLSSEEENEQFTSKSNDASMEIDTTQSVERCTSDVLVILADDAEGTNCTSCDTSATEKSNHIPPLETVDNIVVNTLPAPSSSQTQVASMVTQSNLSLPITVVSQDTTHIDTTSTHSPVMTTNGVQRTKAGI